MRTILHIDMNSYFASVAQANNTDLQNKPIAVMGKGKGTVVIAASKEAKLFGIKTGTTRSEAIQRFPNIIFVEPDFASYVHTTSIILEIMHSFTPIVEPFSIDEEFLDITNTYEIEKGMHPIDFAKNIKEKLRQKLGDVITCSIGIADNKLMAKFASDLQKPDGLIYLAPDKYITVLDKYPITDICGIGRNLYARLENIGVKTTQDLRKIPFAVLKRDFGNVTGRFLYNASRGKDFHKVDPLKYYTNPKSVSHAETFIDKKSGLVLKSTIYKLCEKVSLKLRRKNLYTKNISLYIKDQNFSGSGFSEKLLYHTNNTLEIFNSIIKFVPENFVSKFICIYATNLSAYKSSDMFGETDKKDKLQRFIDKINYKHGHFTILPASINLDEVKSGQNIEIPFSGFEQDAKTGTEYNSDLQRFDQLDTLLRKDIKITKQRIRENET
jgi:DNA polymerase-4